MSIKPKRKSTRTKTTRRKTTTKKSSTVKKKRVYKTAKAKYKQIVDFYNSLQHPEKYCGKSKLITLRSSYEIQYAIKLDNCDDVVEWSSEDIIVWYEFPQYEKHRYFTDFYIKMKNGKEYVIEVKPAHQTIEPKEKKCSSRAIYNRAMFTYHKNLAKWTAADEYCKNESSKGRKIKFKVITESDLIKESVI